MFYGKSLHEAHARFQDKFLSFYIEPCSASELIGKWGGTRCFTAQSAVQEIEHSTAYEHELLRAMFLNRAKACYSTWVNSRKLVSKSERRKRRRAIRCKPSRCQANICLRKHACLQYCKTILSKASLAAQFHIGPRLRHPPEQL